MEEIQHSLRASLGAGPGAVAREAYFRNLREAGEHSSGGKLVFPSPTGRPLSNATLSTLCRDNAIDAVPHGFRSSFGDWCGETGQPRDVAEQALAHVIKNKAEAAYARSDLFERRRNLVEAWPHYIAV